MLCIKLLQFLQVLFMSIRCESSLPVAYLPYFGLYKRYNYVNQASLSDFPWVTPKTTTSRKRPLCRGSKVVAYEGVDCLNKPQTREFFVFFTDRNDSFPYPTLSPYPCLKKVPLSGGASSYRPDVELRFASYLRQRSNLVFYSTSRRGPWERDWIVWWTKMAAGAPPNKEETQLFSWVCKCRIYKHLVELWYLLTGKSFLSFLSS